MSKFYYVYYYPKTEAYLVTGRYAPDNDGYLEKDVEEFSGLSECTQHGVAVLDTLPLNTRVPGIGVKIELAPWASGHPAKLFKYRLTVEEEV